MMWRKSWWECRFRVLCAALIYLCVSGGALVLLSHRATAAPPSARLNFYVILLACLITPIVAVLLAGSGINSQTSWGMLHGFHASMYFLLSLPVSRRRALLIRSAMGGVFTALFVVLSVCTISLLALWSGTRIPPNHVLGRLPFILLGAFGLYGLSTLLTIVFDEFWAGMLGMAIIGFLFGMEIAFQSLPIRFQPAEILSGEQFILTGAVGWPLIAFFFLLGVISMAASVYLVERKEY
jgi:ABC-type transport system involved in multi-copper enzyme maturation permease subunit